MFAHFIITVTVDFIQTIFQEIYFRQYLPNIETPGMKPRFSIRSIHQLGTQLAWSGALFILDLNCCLVQDDQLSTIITINLQIGLVFRDTLQETSVSSVNARHAEALAGERRHGAKMAPGAGHAEVQGKSSGHVILQWGLGMKWDSVYSISEIYD